MSTSSLHHHFKLVTAMSPLQFQKQLRLHQARRLMLIENIDAAAAGHRVGYESPSQFSREYRRLFGAPPRAEIAQMRSVVQA
jgi:AraC-like DNA-binding protein